MGVAAEEKYVILNSRKGLPSRDNDFKKTREVWCEEKRLRDHKRTGCPSNLWYIHGKLYDLSNYLDKHPGR